VPHKSVMMMKSITSRFTWAEAAFLQLSTQWV